MPRPSTGSTQVLYVMISPAAKKHLSSLLKDTQEKSGWKVTRPLLMNKLIQQQTEGFFISETEVKWKGKPRTTQKKVAKKRSSKKA